MNFDLNLCLPRQAETVRLVRGVITDLLRLFGVEDECLEDIRLAVSEACTNVIEYAASHDEYEITIHLDELRCAVTVKNTGPGFDIASLLGEMPSAEAARGRGVPIMGAMMTEVNLNSSPQAGTIVQLVRALAIREDSPLNVIRRSKP